MGTPRNQKRTGGAVSLSGKHPNDKPKSKARETTACDCCTGLTTGPGIPVGCGDGAMMTLVGSLPPAGSWVLVYTAGVGWGWVNAGPLITPGEGVAAPAVIQPTKDDPPPAPLPDGGVVYQGNVRPDTGAGNR